MKGGDGDVLKPKLLKSFNNLLPNCPDKDRPKILKCVEGKKIEENQLDPKLIILRTAAAYIRHEYTNYNKMVSSAGRYKARMNVNKQVEDTMRVWRTRQKTWDEYQRNFTGKVFNQERG